MYGAAVTLATNCMCSGTDLRRLKCQVTVQRMSVTILYMHPSPPPFSDPLPCRKEIFTKVNNFVLLNLSITLFVALIVFVCGIQTATWNVVSEEGCVLGCSLTMELLCVCSAVYISTLRSLSLDSFLPA